MYREKIERSLLFNPREAALQAGARNPGRLASALASDNQARLSAMLQETGDSYLGQPFQDFIDLAERLGFTPIQGDYGFNNGETRFMVLERTGMLIITDSYQDMVNQAYLISRGRADSVRQGLKHTLAGCREPKETVYFPEDRELMPPDLRAKTDPSCWPQEIRRQLKAGN